VSDIRVGSVVIDCNDFPTMLAFWQEALHLDLYTSDREGEVERLVEFGATILPRDAGPGEDFITLVDPEGNVFDVIQKSAPPAG
jgi:hypothetical protein